MDLTAVETVPCTAATSQRASRAFVHCIWKLYVRFEIEIIESEQFGIATVSVYAGATPASANHPKSSSSVAWSIGFDQDWPERSMRSPTSHPFLGCPNLFLVLASKFSSASRLI